jgi:hypothetical protein
MSELLREFRLPLRGRKKERHIEMKTGSEREGGGNRGRERKLARLEAIRCCWVVRFEVQVYLR